MDRRRKAAVAAVSLLVVVAAGCTLALSLCGSVTADSPTSESEIEAIVGKPRIVEIESLIAPGERGQGDDASAEETAAEGQAVPSLGRRPVEISGEESGTTDNEMAPPAAPSPSQQDEDPIPVEPAIRWVVDYKQVWVEDSPAWDEQVPVYSRTEESVCNVCGAVITGNEAAHGKAHMLAGEGSGHHTEYVETLVGYDTVHHDASGHWETIEDGGHWE